MDSMISIIVPVYNVENELKRCVDSIINQMYRNLEIILVDDGSSDKSPSICDSYKEKDERVVVVHKSNGGLSSARNSGLRLAKGKYILYVDSDDYIEKNACDVLLQGVIDDTVDFVVGVLKEIHGNKIFYQKHSNIEIGSKIGAKDFIMKSIMDNEWYAPAVLNMYRREFLLRNNLFYKEGRFYEDMEMLPRLYMAAETIVYTGVVFYNYVIRENSITTSINNPIKTRHAVQNYVEWKELFDTVDDKDLRKLLYGFLVRCYLKTCRTHRIEGWQIEGVDKKFAIRKALGMKEKFKVLMFSFFSRLYIK